MDVSVTVVRNRLMRLYKKLCVRKEIVQTLIWQNFLKPKDIKDFLDQYVIGQDDAKRYLSVAVYKSCINVCCNLRRKMMWKSKNPIC